MRRGSQASGRPVILASHPTTTAAVIERTIPIKDCPFSRRWARSTSMSASRSRCVVGSGALGPASFRLISASAIVIEWSKVPPPSRSAGHSLRMFVRVSSRSYTDFRALRQVTTPLMRAPNTTPSGTANVFHQCVLQVAAGSARSVSIRESCHPRRRSVGHRMRKLRVGQPCDYRDVASDDALAGRERGMTWGHPVSLVFFIPRWPARSAAPRSPCRGLQQHAGSASLPPRWNAPGVPSIRPASRLTAQPASRRYV
jgi:hypothetical protein